MKSIADRELACRASNAIRNESVEEMRALIAEGLTVESEGTNPTLVLYAVSIGQMEIYRLLVDCGFIPAVPDERRIICEAAAFYGRRDILAEFLSLFPKDSYESSLKAAATQNRFGCVELLLSHGVNPNANGGEALKFAIINDARETIRVLLAGGADVSGIEAAASFSFSNGARNRELTRTAKWARSAIAETARELPLAF